MAILPNTDIDLLNVSSTIGAVIGGNLSTDLGTVCSYPGINKWAKYKPVRFAADFTEGHPNWWKASDMKRGIDIPIYTDMYSMVTDIRANRLYWGYNPPRGGQSEPYRLEDFRGHDTNAMPPIQSGRLGEVYYVTGGVPVSSVMVTQANAGWFTASDLFGDLLGNLYYGAAISKQGSASAQYITETDTITSTGGGAVSIPLTSYGAGTYEIFQFLCENKKTSLTSPDISNKFIPIPAVQMQVISVIESALSVSVAFVWANRRTSGTIYITNSGTSEAIITGQSCMIRYGDNANADPMENGETTISIAGTLTIPGKSSYEIPITQSNSLPNYPSRGGRATYTANAGKLQGTGLIGSET